MQKIEKDDCVVCEKAVATLSIGGKPICEGCLDQVLKSSCTNCPEESTCELTWTSVECVLKIKKYLV